MAIVPPPEVREAALREARSLPWSGRVRWLPPQNVHLTLKFLGESPEPGGLHDALRAVCGRHRPLDLDLRGAGAFPSPERARVLWVGVGKGSEALGELAGSVEGALEELGFARERRPFHPHATVGRARERVALQDPGLGEKVGPLAFTAQRVDLVRSRLSEEGAAYSTVASYPLGR